MAIVTPTRTYNPGDQLTAAYYNADRNEIIAGVNSITNAQVASNAGILESKILFNTASGHDHDGVTSKKISINNFDFSGLSANEPVFVNGSANGFQTHLITNSDLDGSFLLPEAQVTFDPVSGHIHDGALSAKVPVVNLDPTGLTPLEFVRVDATGTMLETAPVSLVKSVGWFVDGVLTVNTDQGPNPITDQDITFTSINAYVKVAPVGADIIISITDILSNPIGSVTITDGTNNGVATFSTAVSAATFLSLNILQVGSTTQGEDLTVIMSGTV